MQTVMTETELEAFIDNVLRIRVQKIQFELFRNNTEDGSWFNIIERLKSAQLIGNLGYNPSILPETTYQSYVRYYSLEIELLNHIRDLRKECKSQFEIMHLVKAWHDQHPFAFPTEDSLKSV